VKPSPFPTRRKPGSWSLTHRKVRTGGAWKTALSFATDRAAGRDERTVDGLLLPARCRSRGCGGRGVAVRRDDAVVAGCTRELQAAVAVVSVPCMPERLSVDA